MPKPLPDMVKAFLAATGQVHFEVVQISNDYYPGGQK